MTLPSPRFTCPISFASCRIYTQYLMSLTFLSLAISTVFVSSTFLTPSDCPIQTCLLTDFQQQTDYFPVKVTVEHGNFAVDYYNNFKVLSNKNTGEQYVITLCGTPAPLNNSLVAHTVGGQSSLVPLTLAPTAKFFTGPITKVAIDETITANMLELLGARSLIAAVDVTYITSPCLHAMRDMGVIPTFESTYGNLTQRNQIISQMDAVLGGNDPNSAPKFIQASVTIESSPQGRLEWIKFLGALLNREFAAQTLYNDILGRYNALKTQAATVANGTYPVVAWLNYLAASKYNATWIIKTVSYQQIYTHDAGAIPYAPVNNTFYHVNDAVNALIAGNINIVIDETYIGYYPNRAYADFLSTWGLQGVNAPFLTNKQVWRDDKMHTPVNLPYGADDWFERAIPQIDAVLQDLITIIHPSAVTAKDRVWFRHFSIDEPYGATLDRCMDISSPLFPLLEEPRLKDPVCPTIPIETEIGYIKPTTPMPTGKPTNMPTTSTPTKSMNGATTIQVGIMTIVMAFVASML